MQIVVIDGQGGRLGREVVGAVRDAFPAAEIKVVGTNSVATATMLKAGASEGPPGRTRQSWLVVVRIISSVLLGSSSQTLSWAR